MTEVIDSNESVVNRYRYTPFGQSMVKNESVYNPYQYTFRNFYEIPNVGGIAPQFQQTGRRYDEERGNYYYRARIYDQGQSRFLSNDPAEQGANLYAYVGILKGVLAKNIVYGAHFKAPNSDLEDGVENE